MSGAGLMAGWSVDLPVHAALYTNRKNALVTTATAAACGVSGRLRLLD